MTVQNILNEKGTKVATVRPHETIGTLVHKLKLENIGSVVVSQDGKRVDGIISERDVVRGLAAHGAELLSMRVDKLMIRDVLTCAPEDSVKDVMQTMTSRRVRHLPVVETDRERARRRRALGLEQILQFEQDGGRHQERVRLQRRAGGPRQQRHLAREQPRGDVGVEVDYGRHSSLQSR